MSKQIYTVFACDEWKSRDSLRLLMATTSVRKLKNLIIRKIADEVFTYDKGEGFPFPNRSSCSRRTSRTVYGTRSTTACITGTWTTVTTERKFESLQGGIEYVEAWEICDGK